MNADDLARLELAKRAYRSTEPNAAEVQRGVRKARLGLQRPRVRSTWLTKTVIAFALTMGGLAFAKPQALGELVQTALRSAPSGSKHQGGSGLAAAPAALVPQQRKAPAAQPAQATPAAVSQAAAPQVAEPARLVPAPATKAVGVPKVAQRAEVAEAPVEEAPLANNTPTPPSKRAASAGSFPDASASKGTPSAQQVTEWGRVGSALAKGDETRALAVLNELSESEDRRTRDKADLGRAQLMMSNGNRDKACATARSLTNRGAGSRIERQAQVLLKGCNR